MEGIKFDVNELATQLGDSIVAGLNIVGEKLGVAGEAILRMGVRWQFAEGIAMMVGGLLSFASIFFTVKVFKWAMKNNRPDPYSPTGLEIAMIFLAFASVAGAVGGALLLCYGLIHIIAPEAMLLKEAAEVVKCWSSDGSCRL